MAKQDKNIAEVILRDVTENDAIIAISNGEAVRAKNIPFTGEDGKILDVFMPEIDIVADGVIEPENKKAVNGGDIYKYGFRDVGTISELRNIEGKEGQTIRLLGYYETGDKPELLYKWVNGVGEDDGGSVIVSDGGYWSACFVDSVDVRDFGAIGDGIFDNTNIINRAISNNSVTIVPSGVFRVTDTIKVGSRSKQFTGVNEFYRNISASKTPVILYDGAVDNKKAVILIGSNDVGAEPTIDATNIQFSHIHVNANNKAGFGVYGTYLTNETLIEKITVEKSLEYNVFFAKGWYANFRDIISLGCRNIGQAYGMPLVFSDGELINWTSLAPLELNNCFIRDIRSVNSGGMYSSSTGVSYDISNITTRKSGYGIGCGSGNSFHLDGFLSEKSGGVGLYVICTSQPVKNITNGYLEANHYPNNPATSGQILLESISGSEDSIVLENIFININSGGIYHTGNTNKRIWLKNIRQPTFLKSLDNVRPIDLYSFVLKQDVYYGCGYVNTNTNLAREMLKEQVVDTRYSFEVDVPVKQYGTTTYQLIEIKGSGVSPFGSYVVTYVDDTTNSYNYEVLNSATFVKHIITNKAVKKINKGGGSGADLSNVTFRVYSLFTTNNN